MDKGQKINWAGLGGIFSKIDETVLKAKINAALDMLKSGNTAELAKKLGEMDTAEMMQKINEFDEKKISEMKLNLDEVKSQVTDKDLDVLKDLLGDKGEFVVDKIKSIIFNKN